MSLATAAATPLEAAAFSALRSARKNSSSGCASQAAIFSARPDSAQGSHKNGSEFLRPKPGRHVAHPGDAASKPVAHMEPSSSVAPLELPPCAESSKKQLHSLTLVLLAIVGVIFQRRVTEQASRFGHLCASVPLAPEAIMTSTGISTMSELTCVTMPDCFRKELSHSSSKFLCRAARLSRMRALSFDLATFSARTRRSNSRSP
mmetsp:Transcript_53312/g.152070  ORF Transcript_53312/g.152070 Transcript_53312/m.152070 type:complete len:204 (+) Transcript_53312:179-790(+)